MSLGRGRGCVGRTAGEEFDGAVGRQSPLGDRIEREVLLPPLESTRVSTDVVQPESYDCKGRVSAREEDGGGQTDLSSRERLGTCCCAGWSGCVKAFWEAGRGWVWCWRRWREVEGKLQVLLLLVLSLSSKNESSL